MKRILTIIFLLVLNFTLKAQIPQEPNTYGYNFKRVGADSLLWIPKDTLQVPSWGVGKTHISRKGTTLYYWDGTKWSAISGSGGTYTAGNGLTLSGSQFKLGGTLTEPTIITGSETNLLKLDGYTSANVGYLGIGTDFGYIRFGDGGAFSPTYENEIYGGVSQIGLKTTGDIYLDAGDIYTIGIPTVSSTTGRKVALIDTATGKVERIDPSALSGGSQTLQQVLTTGSTLTTNNTIASGANSLTFSNDRGTVVFDNTSNPLVKLNGTGSAALFQADSAGINKMRLTSRGQLALGDSVNLSIFIGHNSGLNYSPQGAVGNPPGRWNNALGTNALQSLTIGNDNIAIGTNAVRYLEDGTHNIGIGTATLNGCTTCDDNIMIGVDAGASITGVRNTAVGSYGQYLQNGTGNTSFGYGSQYGIVAETHTASYNTSIGYQSLSRTTVASSNTAAGYQSLFTLSTGGGFQGSNTAYGAGSGYTTNGDYNLFLGNGSGYYSNESNAFYLHALTAGISNENDGKNYSMFYGKFANAGANKLRMNGKFGIHSTNNDAAWLPDSAFHVVGNSWLNGKLRITDGTQSNGYVLTSDANGNASWQASSSGFTNPMTTEGDLILATTGGTATRLGIGANGYVLTSNGTTASWQAASAGSPAGNYGNIQLNRNGAFATPGSDSVGYTTSGGFVVKNNAHIGDASNNVATLNIAAKDGEGKLAFKYSTTDYGYFKVNTGSGQVSLGSDQYPVTINSGGTVTINNDFALNTTTLGLGRKMSLRYTGVEYGYFAVETNNSEFRAVSPNAYDFTWRGGSGELMRLKESNGSLGIGASPAASAKLTVTSTTQGFLPPRMTGTQAEAISSPAEGLMIYSTDGSGSTITSKGWWGYDGTNWVKLN